MKTITFTEENYLKAIYVLSGEATGRIANQSIANRLEINPATVTEMLHRLRDKRLIEYSRTDGARLYKSGEGSGNEGGPQTQVMGDISCSKDGLHMG